MNLTTQDLLKHSLVINIDDERLKWFKKVFKFHGLTPMPRKFQGTTLWYNSPQYNCYLSHKNAILTAKKRKWPYVCVFEDDAYPCVNVVEEIDKYLKLLPDDCQVLSLGNIMMWAANADDPNFYRSYQSYGSQSYVVFQSAYDKFIQMLDKAPEGDGAFYSRYDDILPKDSFYMPKKNLFIQFTRSKAMNNSGGYVWLDVNRCTAKNGKFYISPDNTISEDEVVEMGFPRVGEISGDPKDFNMPMLRKSSKPLVFATVNAGTNTFTNITIKSILKFHPDAKVFVVDVTKDPNDAFRLVDEEDNGNVEVMKGVLWDELNLPTIKVADARNISVQEQIQIVHTFHENDKIEVLPCGDYQHPINIQFAVDTIGDNFVLIDSDAPMIRPIDTMADDDNITSAQVEQWNYIHMDRLRPLLNPNVLRTRFCPYIQYLNVEMMKDKGVKYFDADTLKDNLDMAGWFKNPDCGGKESLFFWTGSLFYRYVGNLRLPFHPINYAYYVDHFGGATWLEKGDRHRLFIEKYKHLFRNQDAISGKTL